MIILPKDDLKKQEILSKIKTNQEKIKKSNIYLM